MTDLHTFLMLDAPVLAAGILASISCAVLGAFLVLRRMSLMGDAISHAVLPGIVAGFLVAGAVRSLPIFIGAAAAGVLTALLTEFIHRRGRVESTAAMGVVFTVLFALGVLMIEKTGTAHAHIDADCILYGAMETVVWLSPPAAWGDLLLAETWAGLPRQVITLAAVLAGNLIFIAALFKELRITSFDPGLAAAQGMRPGLIHGLLMTFVAVTVIAAFEAVGSILVVAMLIVPGMIAHLFTNRLGSLLMLAALIGAAAASLGWGTAAAINASAAAMIGVMLGVMLALAVIVSLLRRRLAPEPPAAAPGPLAA